MTADNRILTTDWSKYDGKKHCVFEPALMSPRELEAGTEWVRAPVLLVTIDRPPPCGLAGGSLVESSRNVGYMFAGLWNAGPSWDPARGGAGL